MNDVTALDLEVPERRRFCRIDDEVILHVRPLVADGAAGLAVPDRVAQLFRTCSLLAEHREHIRGLLRDLRSESSRVSRCLAAMEERIELIESHLITEQIDACPELRRTVRLSAGGISLRTRAAYGPNALLLLQLILLPTLTGIVSHGCVLRSARLLARDGEPPFLTNIEFVDMRESTRDLIARHVLTRQRHRGRQIGAAGLVPKADSRGGLASDLLR